MGDRTATKRHVLIAVLFLCSGTCVDYGTLELVNLDRKLNMEILFWALARVRRHGNATSVASH